MRDSIRSLCRPKITVLRYAGQREDSVKRRKVCIASHRIRNLTKDSKTDQENRQSCNPSTNVFTDLDDIDRVNERDSDNSGASSHTHLLQKAWSVGSSSHDARLRLMLLGLHGDNRRGEELWSTAK